ncbi:hypothetical protein LMH71_01390 [Enterovibrio norvegicus]|nr:hypothetical protein [Enterovibrio norvegicus]
MKATKKSEYADSSVFTVDKACLLVTFHGHLPYHLGPMTLQPKTYCQASAMNHTSAGNGL